MPENPPSHDSEQCWAEFRSAAQQLETAMTDLQDAVDDLDATLADVDGLPTDGPHVETGPDGTPADAASD